MYNSKILNFWTISKNIGLLYVIQYFFSDLPIIIFFLLCLILLHFINIDYLKYLVYFLLLTSCFHYYVDIVCIKIFYSRAQIPAIFFFISKEWFKAYRKKVFLLFIIFFAICAVSFFTWKNINLSIFLMIIMLLLLLIFYFTSKYIIINKMGKNLKFLWNIYTLNNFYKWKNRLFYEDYKHWDPNIDYINYFKKEKWNWKKINIILIFQESLSAIDSEILWWNNNMPLFDKIQKDWITFLNFISNWTISLWWHVSTLLWVLPYQYESYRWFKNIISPLPEFLNNQWYNTTFISSVSLSFLNQKDFLKKIWFQKIIWEEFFKNKRKYTMNAAPDWDLYDKVISEIKNQKWNYFIWLQTISLHSDFWGYMTPYWKTRESAQKYCDETLFKFYQKLKDLNYFNDGILIIVWDHRKQSWIDKWEFEKFWNSRFSRSAATVVWKNIWKGIINKNIIQHSDIFYSLYKLIWNWDVLIDGKYNNIFNGEANRNWGITLNPWKIWWNNQIAITYANKSYTFNQITKENINNNDIYDYLTSELIFQIKWENIETKIMNLS